MKPGIIFLDDDQNVLDSYKRSLRNYRNTWNMEFFNDPLWTIMQIEKGLADVLILDLKMPRLNGMKILEKLQETEEGRQTQVIVITGMQDAGLKRQALNLGAIDLLNKPVNTEDLVSRISNVIKLKEYSNELIQKNEELEYQLFKSQRIELIGWLASGLLHDLGSLHQIIGGVTELLGLDPNIQGRTRDKLSILEKSSHRAQEIVKQIMFLGSQKKGPGRCSLIDVISECVSLLQPIHKYRINIHWEYTEQDIEVDLERIHLFQLILNIMKNAIESIEAEGEVHIRIDDTEDILKNDEQVKLLISDTGKGMDRYEIKNIFTPFHSNKDSNQNYGIGLTVIKYIIDKYNCNLKIFSTPAEGTTFDLILPKSDVFEDNIPGE